MLPGRVAPKNPPLLNHDPGFVSCVQLCNRMNRFDSALRPFLEVVNQNTSNALYRRRRLADPEHEDSQRTYVLPSVRNKEL